MKHLSKVLATLLAVVICVATLVPALSIDILADTTASGVCGGVETHTTVEFTISIDDSDETSRTLTLILPTANNAAYKVICGGASESLLLIEKSDDEKYGKYELTTDESVVKLVGTFEILTDPESGEVSKITAENFKLSQVYDESNFASEYTLSPVDAEAYNAYEQYLLDLAAYDKYLTELEAYRENAAAWVAYNQYLADKAAYDDLESRWADYNQYLEEYSVWEEYFKDMFLDPPEPVDKPETELGDKPKPVSKPTETISQPDEISKPNEVSEYDGEYYVSAVNAASNVTCTDTSGTVTSCDEWNPTDGESIVDTSSATVLWTLDSDGVLTLDGNGSVPEYAASNKLPWKNYFSAIKTLTVEDGISSLDLVALASCNALEAVKIYGTNTIIPDGAIPSTVTIYGYTGSTAEEYATKHGNSFISLDEVIYITGDFNDDGKITLDDAIYLCYYIFNRVSYPLNQPADFTGDGNVTLDDAIYLLYHIFNPTGYPIE